jgi:hypothetical protein
MTTSIASSRGWNPPSALSLQTCSTCYLFRLPPLIFKYGRRWPACATMLQSLVLQNLQDLKRKVGASYSLRRLPLADAASGHHELASSSLTPQRDWNQPLNRSWSSFRITYTRAKHQPHHDFVTTSSPGPHSVNRYAPIIPQPPEKRHKNW